MSTDGDCRDPHASPGAPTLPARRPTGRPCPHDVQATRDRLAVLANSLTLEYDGVDTRSLPLGPTRAIVCTPTAGHIACDVVWFHGGGFRHGAPEFSLPVAGFIARHCAARVMVPSYPLAPEEPFPNALHLASAVLRGVGGRSRPLFVGGESAGGGLAAATIAAGAHADGLVLLSPWLDLSVTSQAYQLNAGRDDVFSGTQAREAADQYLQGHDVADPLASPLRAVDERFPPTAIVVGAGEVLIDDAVAMSSRLAAADVECALHIVAGMPHVGPLLDPQAPSSSIALRSLATWIGALTDRSRTTR